MFQRNAKISYALGLEELILLKWPYYPKKSTELMQSLSNYKEHFSQNQNKKFNSFYGDKKETQDSQTILRGKNGDRGIRLSDFRLHYKAIVIKTVQSLAQKQKYRSMEQGRQPRDKPMHICSINLQQSRQDYTMEKRQSLQ